MVTPAARRVDARLAGETGAANGDSTGAREDQLATERARLIARREQQREIRETIAVLERLNRRREAEGSQAGPGEDLRRLVWERDQHRCVRCVQLGIDRELTLEAAHIDHVVSGKRGTNRIADLRTLCRYHHVLRATGGTAA